MIGGVPAGWEPRRHWGGDSGRTWALEPVLEHGAPPLLHPQFEELHEPESSKSK